MKLEEKLAQLRAEKKLSQSDLAEMMHVARQTVSRWENGASVPSAENIRFLSELYGIPADALLREEQTTQEVPTAEEPEAEPVGPAPETAPARPGSRRKLAGLLAAVLVIGVIVGVIWWVSKESNADDDILIIGNMGGTSFDQPDEFFHLTPTE